MDALSWNQMRLEQGHFMGFCESETSEHLNWSSQSVFQDMFAPTPAKKLWKLFSSWQVFKVISRFFFSFLVFCFCFFNKSEWKIQSSKNRHKSKTFFIQIILSFLFLFKKIIVTLSNNVFDHTGFLAFQWYPEIFLSSEQRCKNCSSDPTCIPSRLGLGKQKEHCPKTQSSHSLFLLPF